MVFVPFRMAMTAAAFVAMSAGPALADVIVTSFENTIASFELNVIGTGTPAQGTAQAMSAASFTSIPGRLTGDTAAFASVSGDPHDAAVLGYGFATGGFHDTLAVQSQAGGATPVHFDGVLQIAGFSNCLTAGASGPGDRCLNTVSNPVNPTYAEHAAVENLLGAVVGVTDDTEGTLLDRAGFTNSFVNAGDFSLSLPLSFDAFAGDELGLTVALDLRSLVSWVYPPSDLTAGLATLDLVANLYLSTSPGGSFISESGATYIAEPASMLLLVSGLLGLLAIRRRRVSPPAESTAVSSS